MISHKLSKNNLSVFSVRYEGQITAEESLFFYRDGESTASLARPDHVPLFADELNISSLSQEIRDACGTNLECIFDAVETGSIAFGQQTSQEQETFVATEANVGKHYILTQHIKNGCAFSVGFNRQLMKVKFAFFRNFSSFPTVFYLLSIPRSDCHML